MVIDGPRFSTRAESRWYAAQGWTIVGMTGHPEAVLARELALCYTSLSLVTDTDAGVDEGEGVTHEEVMRVFAQNVAKLRGLLMNVIENLPERAGLLLPVHAGRAEAADRAAVAGRLPGSCRGPCRGRPRHAAGLQARAAEAPAHVRQPTASSAEDAYELRKPGVKPVGLAVPGCQAGHAPIAQWIERLPPKQ